MHKKPFRIFGEADEVITREIDHPGSRAQPFIRTAFDNKYKKANETIRKKLMDAFDDILQSQLG